MKGVILDLETADLRAVGPYAVLDNIAAQKQAQLARGKNLTCGGDWHSAGRCDFCYNGEAQSSTCRRHQHVK